MADGLVKLEIDGKQLAEIKRVFEPDLVRKVLRDGVNRTLRDGNTQLKRSIAKHLNIKSPDAAKALKVYKARGDDLSGLITISQKPIPLIAMKGARAGKRGVSVKIFGEGSRVLFRHAFKANVKNTTRRGKVSEHGGFFMRLTAAASRAAKSAGLITKKLGGVMSGGSQFSLKRHGNNKYVPRLPIAEMFAPSVLTIFGERGEKEFAKKEFEEMQNRLAGNIDDQMDRFFKKKAEASAKGEEFVDTSY